MPKYIWFEMGENRFPNGMSGVKTTELNGGQWHSISAYGPDVQDWWRSKCGHTVDKILEFCPVCHETRPE